MANDFLNDSRIDEMRERWHGDAVLRLLAQNATKDKFVVVADFEDGFLLTRNFETKDVVTALLTLELRGRLTWLQLVQRVFAVDLVQPAASGFERWLFSTKTPPSAYSDRYICTLNAKFNDKTVIEA